MDIKAIFHSSQRESSWHSSTRFSLSRLPMSSHLLTLDCVPRATRDLVYLEPFSLWLELHLTKLPYPPYSFSSSLNTRGSGQWTVDTYLHTHTQNGNLTLPAHLFLSLLTALPTLARPSGAEVSLQLHLDYNCRQNPNSKSTV